MRQIFIYKRVTSNKHNEHKEAKANIHYSKLQKTKDKNNS